MYRQRVIRKRTQEVLSSIFRKIRCVFSCRQSQGQVYPPTVILYEVLPEVYPSISQSDVNNRITRLRQAGYLIVIIILREPIPNEYIGRMTVWNELVKEAPIHRKIEAGYFDKIVSVP